MDRLLGHLAQFGSFWQQGELLCNLGLAYLLRDAEGERAFTGWISSATGYSLSPGLRWLAESRQEDRGRPDLEGRDAQGRPVVKIEAKLGAAFGQGQLKSYVSALCASGGDVLLLVVPKSRVEEITAYASALFEPEGVGPWRIPCEAAGVGCAVVSWDDGLEALSAVTSARFRDDPSQFEAMYQGFDKMGPRTSVKVRIQAPLAGPGWAVLRWTARRLYGPNPIFQGGISEPANTATVIEVRHAKVVRLMVYGDSTDGNVLFPPED